MEELEQMQYEAETGDYEIRTYPSPVLKEVAAPVEDEEFGPEIEKIGEQMLNLIRYHGIGLAGPQIGLLKRIFVVHVDREKPAMVICNPTLTFSPTTSYADEGCLSMPDLYEQVKRPSDICIDYRTPTGEFRHEYFDGMTARAIQHETDHLDGILFIDRLTRNLRRQALRRWEELERVRARRQALDRVYDTARAARYA